MRLKVPLHITGFWVPHITNNPLTTGSLGAGITLEPFVEAEIKESPKDEVLVNSRVLKHDLIDVVKKIVGVD
ncbi:MAG: kinase, partial [Zestosphaera sp.]